MSAVPLEILNLPTFAGLRLLDAWSGLPVPSGLGASLRRKRDGAVLGRAVASLSGVHHWPELAESWRSLPSISPAPAPLAEVWVDDLAGRFLPVRVDWPLVPSQPDFAITDIMLVSTPQRPTPVGAASVVALLTREDGSPAAFARVVVTDAQGRSTAGMSDGRGRLALHFPFPRPERRPGAASPASPALSQTPALTASLSLAVFHDPSVAAEAHGAARRFGGFSPLAPLLDAWAVQRPVLALAELNAVTPFQLRIESGKPCVLRTQGLPPDRSELRLVPP